MPQDLRVSTPSAVLTVNGRAYFADSTGVVRGVADADVASVMALGGTVIPTLGANDLQIAPNEVVDLGGGTVVQSARDGVLRGLSSLQNLAARLATFVGLPVGSTAALASGVSLLAVATAYTRANPLSAIAAPAFAASTGRASAKEILVDTSTTYQTWVGLGSCLTDAAAYIIQGMSAAQRLAILTEYFVTNGANFVRLPMGDSDATTRYASGAFKTYDDTDTDGSLTNFSMAIDDVYIFPVLQQILALRPDLKIMASPWSPPAFVKSPAQLVGGASVFVATAANMTFYANYFVKYAQGVKARIGRYPDYFTVQNEPNYSPGNYPGCYWNASDLVNFAYNYLKPALVAANIPTKLLTGDASWGDTSQRGGLVTGVLSTANGLSAFDGAAYHGYDGTPAQMGSDMAPYGGKELHLSEDSVGLGDGSNGATHTQLTYIWQQYMIGGMRFGAQSAIYWTMATDPNGYPGPNTTIQGSWTVDSSGNVVRQTPFLALAHVGRYLKPGAVRVACNTYAYKQTDADIAAVAWKNPDGSVVVFLFNSLGIGSGAQPVTIKDQQGGGVYTTITLNGDDMATVVFKNAAAVNVPDAPTITASAINGGITLSASGSAPSNNGAAITGYDIYAGASGAETLVASNQPLPYNVAGPNGTPIYAYARARNSAGPGAASLEVTATPTSSLPTKFLKMQKAGTVAFNQGASSIGKAANDPTGGYIEIGIRCNLDSYAAGGSGTSALFSNYYSPSAVKTNSPWQLGIIGSNLIVQGYDAAGTFHLVQASAGIPAMPTDRPVRLRARLNATSGVVNGVAAGGCAFEYSVDDGATYTQIGNVVTTWGTGGIYPAGTAGYMSVGPSFSNSGQNVSISGRIYSCWALKADGTILANPDFTALNDGVNNFADGAPTSNTWQVFGTAYVTDSTKAVADPGKGLFVSEDMGGAAASGAAGWSVSALNSGTAASVTAHNTVTDPIGGATASTLHFPATGSSGYAYDLCQTAANPGTGVKTYSFYARGKVGGEQLLITLADSAVGSVGSNAIVTLSTSWQRFSYIGAISSGGSKASELIVGAGANNPAMDVDLAFASAA